MRTSESTATLMWNMCGEDDRGGKTDREGRWESECLGGGGAQLVKIKTQHDVWDCEPGCILWTFHATGRSKEVPEGPNLHPNPEPNSKLKN